ncbi:MAG: CARDB domain-containing protein [Candidatus Bathyarchaeia archaeon]
MRRLTGKILIAFMLIMAISITPSIKPSISETTTTLRITPQSIIDPTKDIGTTVVYNSTVENVINLWNWQVKIFFNPQILHCKRAWIPSGSPFAFPVAPEPVIDNDNGYVLIGASKIGATPGVSGSGTLACLEFEVRKRGTSFINYSRPYGQDTRLRDNQMNIIEPVTLEDGYFSNWIPPPPAKLYVNPPRFVDPAKTPCNEFNLNISIMSATSLYKWQLSVLFLKDIVSVGSVVEGPFLKSGGSTSFHYTVSSFNETHNLLSISCEITEGVEVSGGGDLVIITFHVENLGETIIAITSAELFDQAGNSLPHQTFNGYFSNILKAILAVDPPEIFDPSLVPCTTFSINITIDDVGDLKTCRFNLTYNSNVLRFVGLTVYTVQNQAPSVKIIQDDEAGYLWIRLTYPNNITTFNPLPLARITFHVDAFGTSPLNLTDTYITDILGQAIAHEAHHGYFASVIRDVAIIDIKAPSNWTYQGWIIRINVTVKNEGDLPETFNVKAFYNETLIGVILVENLPSNETVTITFNWDTKSTPPCRNYVLSAQAGPVPYETDLTDNSLIGPTIKVRLLGDVNGDGIIDMTDIGIACSAFGSNPLHPRWNPDVDINQDNKIDLEDIGLMAMKFGKRC